MGKRGDSSPAPVSARVQAIVDRAKQQHGKQKETPRPNPRPQATPARAASPSTNMLTTPPAAATKAVPSPSPMSTGSTPLKSPDNKRHRSVSSLSLTTPTEVPSLPSFSASCANKPRHSDSSTTISLQQYMAGMTLDKGQNPMKCNH